MFPRLEATAAQVEPEAKPLCCQAVQTRPSSSLLKTKVLREHIQFQSKQNQLASTAQVHGRSTSCIKIVKATWVEASR